MKKLKIFILLFFISIMFVKANEIVPLPSDQTLNEIYSQTAYQSPMASDWWEEGPPEGGEGGGGNVGNIPVGSGIIPIICAILAYSIVLIGKNKKRLSNV